MENCMLSVIHQSGTSARVSEVMDQNFVYVDPKAPLDEVYRQLLSTHKTATAVL
jgi:predicted transcriptional regulator